MIYSTSEVDRLLIYFKGVDNSAAINKNKCPYCDDELPNQMSPRLAKELERIDIDHVRKIRKARVVRYEKRLQNGNNVEDMEPIFSVHDEHEFCRMHIAEEMAVPKGLKLGYPLAIDFSLLEIRVQKMETTLRRIIDENIRENKKEENTYRNENIQENNNMKVKSVFLSKARKRIKNMGRIKSRHPMALIAIIEEIMVSTHIHTKLL